jgi:hypothetical protein
MDDIINQIDGQVQVIFEKSGDYGTFRDAIWMSQTEYDVTSQETINTIKEQRYENWLAIVNPTVVSE